MLLKRKNLNQKRKILKLNKNHPRNHKIKRNQIKKSRINNKKNQKGKIHQLIHFYRRKTIHPREPRKIS